jgi:hypothetical protein
MGIASSPALSLNRQTLVGVLSPSVASIRRNGSGTFQVRYRDPAGRQRARNFARKTDATRFAHAVETDKVRGDWLDPRLGRVTFGEWAEEWLDHVGHLKAKTR